MSGLLRAADEVERLGQDLDAKNGVLDSIKILLAKFPDLMIYRPHPNRKYEIVCCSSAVNSSVDAYDFTDAEDGSVYVWPYTTIDGQRVYSSPPYVRVGEVNLKGFGIATDADWEDRFVEENLSKSVIRKVRAYLKGKPPINYAD